MSNNRLKAAIIGLGHQAREDHIPAIYSCSDVDLVAVVDTDKDRLQKFILENKGVKGYDNIDDLFKKEKLDFIVIVTPHSLHCDIIKKAAAYKIHVLKEKPFAISLKEAKEIKEIAERNGIKIMVTLQRRFNPIYYSFFQLIDKIGIPFFIESKYTFYSDRPHSGWRGDKKKSGGGCLIDMGYHIIDLLMWYFGLPDMVLADMSSAESADMEDDIEDTTCVSFRYNNEKNLFGTMLISRVMYPKQEYLNVYGNKGFIHIERGKIERYASDGQMQESLNREQHWSSAAQDQVEYFIKVINNKRDNIGSPETHYQHLSFIEAAYKSRNEHRYIAPKDFLK